MEKEKRKQIVRELAQQERKAFLQSLPMSEVLFKELFDYLDEHLEVGCNHDYSLTLCFLRAEEIEPEAVIAWLRNHGGYCDCEVLYNVEEFFD